MSGGGPGPELSAGGALLRRLHTLGVGYVFTNSGTDFPPLIEALAEAEANAWEVPSVVVVSHEHIAMGLAHGYYQASGRSQSVILHTNVGLANGAIGAINAATDQVPLLLMSGRTPATEQGRFGARTVPIGWGQEMRDQPALVREATKWEYELRFPEQVPELLDRAHAIANSTPRGPVYLSLPREVLAEPCPVGAVDAPIGMRPSTVRAHPDEIAELASLLLDAERPLIVSQRGAGSEEGFAALARLAERAAIPVCQYWAVATSISADHPMYVGQDPEPWLGDADVVVVLDSLAPWMPQRHRLSDGCVVAHVGPDPLFERFPVRNFPVSRAVRGDLGDALVRLDEAMAAMGERGDDAAREVRRTRVAAHNGDRRTALDAEIEEGRTSPMSKALVARALGDAIRGRKATVLSELGCPLDPLGLVAHGSWRQEPHSGGLGWSFPCGMGMKLADRDRLVVATMGDGSYLFSNPVACHQAAARLGAAVLVVVLNNGGYGAVRDSVLDMYPTGYAAKAEEMPLTSLETAQPLAGVAEACGAHAESVDDPDALAGAIERAIAAVDAGHQAFVEVAVA